MAAINAKKDREAAKAEEKKHQKELRKAEAARRDLEKIAEQERRNAEARAKKEAKLKKQAEARATKAKRTADKPGSNAAKKAAKKDLVKVARIDDTAEFGVFPELCTEYTAANATSIGTKQMCEADRDRINAKRASTTLENVADAATAPAQEELVEVL